MLPIQLLDNAAYMGASEGQREHLKTVRLVNIEASAIEDEGFTPSGSNKYTETVEDYAQELLRRASSLAEANKAQGMQREITHDHVRASAHQMVSSFGKPSRSKWLIVAQVGEYVAAAAAGAGAGHLDTSWGILSLVLGVAIGVILIVVRLVSGKEE